MAHLLLSALLGVPQGLQSHHAPMRRSGGDLPWERWRWWWPQSWGWDGPARRHQLTKQWAAAMQTKQKGNKRVLGEVQGSSRSRFRLLPLPHSPPQALSPGRILLVKKEMWAKHWPETGFHHPWVTVPKHRLFCLAGRAVSQGALQSPLLKASGSELVCNLSHRRKSCKQRSIPSISPGWTGSLGLAPGALLVQSQPELWLLQTLLTLETSNRLEKVSCLLFCLVPSPAGTLR